MPSGIEEPLQFHSDLAETDPKTFSIDDEVFNAVPNISGLRYIQYARKMAVGGIQSLVLVDDFLREVMEAPEYERFEKYVNDASRHVTPETLSTIVLRLFERYGGGAEDTDRPTQPSRPSGTGRPETPDTSKENSSSEGSTLET